MAQRHPYPSNVAQQSKQKVRQVTAHPWFEQFARFGYAAKGLVYLVAGALSARAAFGFGGATTDRRGALVTILSEPFGRLMLVLIGTGRIGYLISAFLYAGLAWTALRLVSGSSGASANQAQGWVARLFALPLGRWLV